MLKSKGFSCHLLAFAFKVRRLSFDQWKTMKFFWPDFDWSGLNLCRMTSFCSSVTFPKCLWYAFDWWRLTSDITLTSSPFQTCLASDWLAFDIWRLSDVTVSNLSCFWLVRVGIPFCDVTWYFSSMSCNRVPCSSTYQPEVSAKWVIVSLNGKWVAVSLIGKWVVVSLIGKWVVVF